MSNLIPVTLIIPSYNNHKNLYELLNSVIFWSKYPSEIIVSDNSTRKFIIKKELNNIYKKKKISIKILYKKNCFPGKARNLAIKKATFSNLAFLDTSTFCKNDWLEANYNLLKKNVDAVIGQTNYLSFSYFSKLFRASSFGSEELKTLPGSLIKKKVFNKIGLFLEKTRSGEDGFFFKNLLKNNINVVYSTSIIDYCQILEINILLLFKKWFRNYYHSASLKFMYLQRSIYLIFFLFFLVSIYLLIFKKPLFFILLSSTYFLIRGIVIPINKNKNLFVFVLINCLIIFFISLFLDIAKFLGFLFHFFSRDKKFFIETTQKIYLIR
jgi:hypothetical protein